MFLIKPPFSVLSPLSLCMLSTHDGSLSEGELTWFCPIQANTTHPIHPSGWGWISNLFYFHHDPHIRNSYSPPWQHSYGWSGSEKEPWFDSSWLGTWNSNVAPTIWWLHPRKFMNPKHCRDKEEDILCQSLPIWSNISAWYKLWNGFLNKITLIHPRQVLEEGIWNKNWNFFPEGLNFLWISTIPWVWLWIWVGLLNLSSFWRKSVVREMKYFGTVVTGQTKALGENNSSRTDTFYLVPLSRKKSCHNARGPYCLCISLIGMSRTGNKSNQSLTKNWNCNRIQEISILFWKTPLFPLRQSQLPEPVEKSIYHICSWFVCPDNFCHFTTIFGVLDSKKIVALLCTWSRWRQTQKYASQAVCMTRLIYDTSIHSC